MPVANDALRFVLELSALAALAYWGQQATDGSARWLLALAAPLAAALVWATWLAPRSDRRLADPGRLLLELGVFGAAVAALWAAGAPWLALVLAALVAAHLSLTFAYGQR